MASEGGQIGMLGEAGSIEVAGRLGLALCMAIFLGLAFEGIYKLDQRANPGGIRSFPMTVGCYERRFRCTTAKEGRPSGPRTNARGMRSLARFPGN